MADPGQHENLIDFLGFDPNQESQAVDSLNPKPTNERYGWPVNWKDLLKTAVKKDEDETYEVVHEDDENLFSINHDNLIGEYHRAYWCFANDSFDIASMLVISPSDQNGNNKIRLTTHSDNEREYTSLDIHPGWDEPISFGKQIGTRSVQVNYFPNGEFASLRFTANSQHYDRSISGDIRKYQDLGVITRSHDILPEFDADLPFEIVGDRIIVKRVEGEQVRDAFDIPNTVDISALKSELIPDHLLRHPNDPNPRLDESWRGRDPFELAGFKWDVVLQDELKSATQISIPPEERLKD